MQTYGGAHDSTRDFPLVKGIAPKYDVSTVFDLEFNFGDVVYVVPGSVLHYIDDKESIGWEHGWQPPQDFINRVMNGGEVKFSASKSEQLTLPHLHIGYLTRRKTENGFELIDTHGGDANRENATPATLGPVPEGFLESMRLLTEKGIEHREKTLEIADRTGEYWGYVQDNDANRFQLPTTPGYENAEITTPAHTLSYGDHFKLLSYQRLEAAGVSLTGRIPTDRGEDEDKTIANRSSTIAGELQFFTLSDGSVVARLDTSEGYYSASKAPDNYRGSKPFSPDFPNKMHLQVREDFAALGINTDSEGFPYIRLSGESVNALQQLGGPIDAVERPEWLDATEARLVGTPEQHFQRAQDQARALLAGQVPETSYSGPLPVTDDIGTHLHRAGHGLEGWEALANAIGEAPEGLSNRISTAEAAIYANEALTQEKAINANPESGLDREAYHRTIQAISQLGMNIPRASSPHTVDMDALDLSLHSAKIIADRQKAGEGPAR